MTLAELYTRLNHAALAIEPDEACGLLLGAPWPVDVATVTVVGVTRIIPFPNVHPDPTSCFVVLPETLRPWRRQYHGAIVAVYHSHPASSARLSEHDTLMLKTMDWPMVIVAPGLDLRLYRRATAKEVGLGGVVEVGNYQPRSWNQQIRGLDDMQCECGHPLFSHTDDPPFECACAREDYQQKSEDHAPRCACTGFKPMIDNPAKCGNVKGDL